MASSPPPSNLASKRFESLPSKRPNRVADHLEDASSFTSMSSNSIATLCRQCKGVESLTNPLIACIRCKSRYHMGCPKPRITDRRADYTCSRCVEKANKIATIAQVATRKSQKNQVGTNDSQGSGETSAEKAEECEGEGCKKPAVPSSKSGTGNLCYICNLVDKAKQARQQPAPKPVVESRPFQKTKLYHLRPDDRPLVKKRKRSASGHTSHASRAKGPRGPAALGASSKKTTLSRHASRAPTQINLRSKKQKSEMTVSPKMAQEQSLHSAVNITSNQFQASTSGSELLHEALDCEYGVPNAAQNPQVTAPIEAQLPPLEPIIEYPEMPSQDSPSDRVAAADDEMTDGPEGDTPALQLPRAPSPLSDSVSDNRLSQSPDFDVQTELAGTPDLIEPELGSRSETPKPVETASEFDESILDSFLQQQAERDPYNEPDSQELLATQNWGTIDPRTVWPKRLTEAQKEQKMIEIAARGGRKKNFGKHLHAQLVQERSDKGWDIHQSREKRDDDEYFETVEHLEELFGVREGTLGNCVPRIVDGQLVMQEREREREPGPRRPGRQKKEVPLGVYPVIGGQ